MKDLGLDVMYENVAGLKVYYSVDDKVYAAVNEDEELTPDNVAVCFDDLLEILNTNTELPGRILASKALLKKREYYINREMEKATTEPFQERFEVLFITLAERFGGLLNSYFVYDKKEQGYVISTYDELMNKFENNTSFEALFEDIDALIEDVKVRDGIVKNLATEETKHRQFEVAVTYLETLKNNK